MANKDLILYLYEMLTTGVLYENHKLDRMIDRFKIPERSYKDLLLTFYMYYLLTHDHISYIREYLDWDRYEEWWQST